MPGFDRTGPRGIGPMTGGGRGLCNPRGIEVENYFLRRGNRFSGVMGYPAIKPWFRDEIPYGYRYPKTDSYTHKATQEEEIDLLRTQSQVIRDQLSQIEARIKNLEPTGI